MDASRGIMSGTMDRFKRVSETFPRWGMSMCFWQSKKILPCILHTTHQLGARLIDWFLCCGTV
jgi:hypothetical protein